MIFQAVRDESRNVAISRLLKLYGCSRASYYRFKAKNQTVHDQIDKDLKARIAEIYQQSGKAYGAPRIYRELKVLGIQTSTKRIARLMKELGIRGTEKKESQSPAYRPETAGYADHVARHFQADSPNKLWVSDITYVRCRSGWLYLAVVLDLFSRRVVGFSCDIHQRASLVSQALGMALYERNISEGLVFHSDHGGQYRSKQVARILDYYNVTGSMGRIASPADNACAEAFMSTFKAECGRKLKHLDACDAQIAIFNYIAGFYNNTRRHSTLGYLSPVEFERQYYKQQNDQIGGSLTAITKQLELLTV